MGARAQASGLTSATFSGHRKGAGSEMEQLGHQPAPVQDAITPSRGLVYGASSCTLSVKGGSYAIVSPDLLCFLIILLFFCYLLS